MPIPLRPSPECPPSGFERPEANEKCHAPPAPKRRSRFGRAFGGVRWLAAAPGEWLGVRVLSRGASFISGLAGRRAPARHVIGGSRSMRMGSSTCGPRLFLMA